MLVTPCYGRLKTQCIVGLLVVLVACPSCSRSSTPLIPPPVRESRPPENPRKEKPIEYRQTAGEAISPTVISDDPPPSSAPGTTQGQGTLKSDSNGLNRDALNRAVQGAMGLFSSCFSSRMQVPSVSVSFQAEPSGRASSVIVSGAPAESEYCIRNVVQGIRFPSFEGSSVKVDLPLSFHQTGGSETPVRPSEQQQPTAPPLFMEP